MPTTSRPPTTGIEGAVAQLETQFGADVLSRRLGAHDVTRDDLLRARQKDPDDPCGPDRDRGGPDRDRRSSEPSTNERALEFTTVQADHILVETQAEARERLPARAGRDGRRSSSRSRAEVSTEPGAKDSGGELRAAPAAQYVPEFASAVVALEPGEISQPVQTQFGWHVIYLVDKEVAPFEEAKAGLLEPARAIGEFHGWLKDRAEAAGRRGEPAVRPVPAGHVLGDRRSGAPTRRASATSPSP